MNILNDFVPFDDIMFSKMAEEKPFCQEILRVIMEDPKLEVVEHIPQATQTNLKGHSLRVDLLCRLGDNTLVNVEIQKSDDDDHEKRVRYHGAVLTANNTPKGSSFKDVVNVCVIYIAKFDIFEEGKAVYHVDRKLREVNRVVYNGFTEIYVNAQVYDGSDISELMKVFTESSAYNDKFPVTSELKRKYKEDPAMYTRLSDIIREEAMEKGLAEGREKGLAEGRMEGLAEGRMEGRMEGQLEMQASIALSMLRYGNTPQLIAESTGIPLNFILNVQRENGLG